MENLKDLRKNAGFSVVELAKELDVTKWTVYAWEAGRSSPRRKSTMVELARLLNISKSDLLDLFPD